MEGTYRKVLLFNAADLRYEVRRWKVGGMQAVKRWSLSGTMLGAACALFFAVGLKSGAWISEAIFRAETNVVLAHTSPSMIIRPSATLPMGRWNPVHVTAGGVTPLGRQLEELSLINALGYLDGTQAPQQSPAVVSRLAPGKEFDSKTLVVSGHAPGAQLIDFDGNVIHEWRCNFDDVWPGRDVGGGEPQKHFWRRAHLYPDGSILGIFEYLGAVKLDSHSRVIWAKDNSFNHDISVTDDGTIYMLEQKPTARPAVNPDLKIMDDHVTRLTQDGDIIDSVSLVDCVLNSPCRTLMDRVLLETADIFHSNTLKVITEEQARVWPIATPGMVLVSFRELHTIALIDLHEKKVAWWSSDVTRYQHEPIVTPRGTIMMFDNIWCPGRSRVVEIDPKDNTIVWQYAGTPQQPFYSLTCSMVQYLPNGELMVTSSDEGRAFSIDATGKPVWEFVNPHRAGEDGELIATLFQCQRLPENFPRDWITPPSD